MQFLVHKKIRNRSQKPEPFLQFISFSGCVMDGLMRHYVIFLDLDSKDSYCTRVHCTGQFFQTRTIIYQNHYTTIKNAWYYASVPTYRDVQLMEYFFPKPLLSISCIHNKNSISITVIGRAFVHSRDPCARRMPEKEERVRESTHWRL